MENNHLNLNLNNTTLSSLDPPKIDIVDKEEEEDEELKTLLSPPRGGMSKNPKKARQKVQWNDRTGNKLVEILEFQPSDASDTDDDDLDSCICTATVIRDKETGRSRGFGIVIYADPLIHDRVLRDEHIIDGRIVETNKILPRNEEKELRQDNHKKRHIFFQGGFPTSLTEEELHLYFESYIYGDVIYVEFILDYDNLCPRVFGFVAFE
ncbi:Heterogeneous nuclear ribonucleoprotein [Thalictrum thalictroides]|uniref:Heterogeneous nuclear ribonucleoprotein n=1 Tax=Thalictrum thalictroides TaxID=46969 RepID=A0A7J6X0B5_THATH|nr:Heterogeneous nuclear ribonucleoprotein [Thalictrum thalictroides]